MQTLTKTEQTRLQELETKVINGQKTFIEVGHALTAIKREKLYRQKADTFDEYCQKTFGWGRQRAYQICAGVAVWDQAKEAGKPAPENERQARKLLEDSKPKNVNHGLHLSPMDERVTQKSALKAGPCSEFGNGTYGDKEASSFYANDPADKIQRSKPEDGIAARSAVLLDVSTPEVFPQMFSFEVNDQTEKDSFRVLAEKILVKRNKKNSRPMIDLQDAIAKVCSAYKRIKGRTLSFKSADAAQLRRQLEGGTTLEEFIAVGEKAWQAPVNGQFKLSKFSHQIAMFVKHFENIREEVSVPAGPDKNTIRETIHVRSL